MFTKGQIQLNVNSDHITEELLSNVCTDLKYSVNNDHIVFYDISEERLSNNTLLYYGDNIKKKVERLLNIKVVVCVKYNIDENTIICHPDALDIIHACDVNNIILNNNLNYDSNVLRYLAGYDAGNVNYIDISNTNIGYNGIVAIWNSSIVGSLVCDMPTYHKHTGMPLSTIMIEIAESKAYKQYLQKSFTYPLPLLDNFTIRYKGLGNSYDLVGYKQIILLCNGKELLKN